MTWWEAHREFHEQIEAAREENEWIAGYDDERPRLNAYELWLWQQFRCLSSQRPPAFGEVPAPIPISEMRAHWEWLELGSVSPPAEFQRYMTLLDYETRRFLAERSEKKREQETTN